MVAGSPTAVVTATDGDDRLAPFSSLVTAVRWGTVTLGLLLAAANTAGPTDVLFGAVLLGYALWRTLRPLADPKGRAVEGLAMVVGELTLTLSVVAATGGWRSPYAIVSVAPIAAMGFGRGPGAAIRMALTVVAAVSLAGWFTGDLAVRPMAEWANGLLLVAAVAGYGRQAVQDAEQRAVVAIGRVTRLAEANALLSELHRVAQALPVSLDFGETVASVVERLRELFEPNTLVILLRDDATSSWSVVAARGLRVPSVLPDDQLPSVLARAAAARGAFLIDDLGPGDPGLSPSSAVGLYAPLRARDQLVGVVAVERVIPGAFADRDVPLFDGVAEQTAVALDNARWFRRLRRMGADEERSRIARDLHDSVGQSLAYLAFELDRICAGARRGDVVQELDGLRDDVRRVVTEVRETLHDLRTDVSENHDIATTIDGFLTRVRQRTGMETAFEHAGPARLPLQVERELWRIAQEAMANAERHSRARHLRVAWRCVHNRATLEVSDDGVGLEPGSGPHGSYGITGMRERADAVGAALEIVSAPGSGTTVRCTLELQQ